MATGDGGHFCFSCSSLWVGHTGYVHPRDPYFRQFERSNTCRLPVAQTTAVAVPGHLGVVALDVAALLDPAVGDQVDRRALAEAEILVKIADRHPKTHRAGPGQVLHDLRVIAIVVHPETRLGHRVIAVLASRAPGRAVARTRVVATPGALVAPSREICRPKTSATV